MNLKGRAVLKVPYSNCGQGVYTIINRKELDEFMRIDHGYDKFILQSLVGNQMWSDESEDERMDKINNNIISNQFYHVGTQPNEKNEKFVFDLRLTVTANKNGFLPVSINFGKARKPLIDNVDRIESSWDVLCTNLSIKLDKNSWDTDTERLLVLDDESFNELNLNLDDLIDAYIQTAFSVIAIDKLCISLYDEDKKFNFDLFKRINPDYSLLNEIQG